MGKKNSKINHNNKPPRKVNKKEEHLLNSEIYRLYIGFIPLGSDLIHRISNNKLEFRKSLPKALGVKRFVHACIFLQTTNFQNKNDNIGILVEYEKYTKNYKNNECAVFFLEKDGLKYIEMTLKEFKGRMEKENEDINNNDGKGKNVPYIEWRVNISGDIFYKLLHRTIFGAINNKNPEIVIYNEIYKEELEEFCDSEQYIIIMIIYIWQKKIGSI